jgi:hypothetical protein
MKGHSAVSISARVYLDDLKLDVGMVGRQELGQPPCLPEREIAAPGSYAYRRCVQYDLLAK